MLVWFPILRWWWFRWGNDADDDDNISKSTKHNYTFNKKVIIIFTVQHGISAGPILLFKLCTSPNIFPYCTVKSIITYKY